MKHAQNFTWTSIAMRDAQLDEETIRLMLIDGIPVALGFNYRTTLSPSRDENVDGIRFTIIADHEPSGGKLCLGAQGQIFLKFVDGTNLPINSSLKRFAMCVKSFLISKSDFVRAQSRGDVHGISQVRDNMLSKLIQIDPFIQQWQDSWWIQAVEASA